MNLYTIIESLSEQEARQRVSKMPRAYQIEIYEFNKTLDCLEVEIDGINIGFAIMSNFQVIKCIELAKQIGMNLKISDITKKAIDGKLDQTVLDDSYLMNNIINKFILAHIDKDTILDKINEHGIESLTDIDKILLTGVAA